MEIFLNYKSYSPIKTSALDEIVCLTKGSIDFIMFNESNIKRVIHAHHTFLLFIVEILFYLKLIAVDSSKHEPLYQKLTFLKPKISAGEL